MGLFMMKVVKWSAQPWSLFVGVKDMKALIEAEMMTMFISSEAQRGKSNKIFCRQILTAGRESKFCFFAQT